MAAGIQPQGEYQETRGADLPNVRLSTMGASCANPLGIALLD
ncbi:hypothetical protein [Sphingobium chungbukense]|nr:hypothetical protein [Sphingobium chungbukense]